MSDVSGTVTLSGSGVSGAKVYLINDNDGTIVGTDTTDSNGDYSIGVGSGGYTAHVVVQYEDSDGNYYNDESKPFVAVAETVTMIDSFEDQDMSEYGSIADSSNFNINQTFVTQGDYGLEISGDDSAESQSGLDNYPSQGDQFRYDFQTAVSTSNASNTHRFFFHFGADTNGNQYRLDCNIDSGQLELWDIGAGDRFAVDFDVSFASNTHYEMDVIWDDGSLGGSQGDFTVTLTDKDAGSQVTQISGNDTSYTSGGIIWELNTALTDNVYVDYARIV